MQSASQIFRWAFQHSPPRLGLTHGSQFRVRCQQWILSSNSRVQNTFHLKLKTWSNISIPTEVAMPDILDRYASLAVNIKSTRRLTSLASDINRKRIARAIMVVDRINAPTIAAKLCKKKLLLAWRLYASRLDGLLSDDPDTSVPPATYIGRTCALETCLCSGKHPAHELRICKGCWQVYYCNSDCQKA